MVLIQHGQHARWTSEVNNKSINHYLTLLIKWIGLNDPPYALHGTTVAALPTPSSVRWGSATNLPAPASTPDPGQPSRTAQPPKPSGSGDPAAGSSGHDPSFGPTPSLASASRDPSARASSNDDPSTQALPNTNPASGDPPLFGDPSSGHQPPAKPPSDDPPPQESSSENHFSGDQASPGGAFSQAPQPIDPSSENGHPGNAFPGSGTNDAAGGIISILGQPSSNDPAGGIISILHEPSNSHNGATTQPFDSNPNAELPSSEGNNAATADPETVDGSTRGAVSGVVPGDQGEQGSGQYSGEGFPDLGSGPSIGGEPIVKDPSHPGGIIIGAQHIAQGQTLEVDGTPVAVGTSDITIGAGSVLPMASLQTAGIFNTPIATIGGEPVYVDPDRSGAVVVGGTPTVQLGQTAVVDGIPISAGSEGLVISGSTLTPHLPAIETGANIPQSAVFKIGSQSLTAVERPGSGGVLVGSTTLSIGGPALTTAGETISAVRSGVILASSGSTRTYAFSAAVNDDGSVPGNNVEVEAPFAFDGKTFTAYELQGYGSSAVIYGPNEEPVTLAVGGPAITMDGQRISLASDGVIIGTASTEAVWNTVTDATMPTQASSLSGGSELGPWTTTSSSTGTSLSGSAGMDPSESTAATTSGAGSIMSMRFGIFAIFSGCFLGAMAFL
ncbi:MAG: hypothetical protein M1820_004592 [Bogoriella megaspora]|nr:MAG: hypothetical protein M1820_004592 [Bogoriella megaspora]